MVEELTSKQCCYERLSLGNFDVKQLIDLLDSLSDSNCTQLITTANIGQPL